MKTLAIQGHLTKGDKVIEALYSVLLDGFISHIQ